jgi:hypothetical protein
MSEYYDKDGYPKKCPSCESTDIEDVIRDKLEYTPTEIEYICSNCKQTLAYWAYGYFGPSYESYLRDCNGKSY